MRSKLVFVVAAARNGVIGADCRTPWRLPTDLRRFRELTWGKPLLMGRRTYESIGGPLPGRETIALSRDPGFRPEGAHVARSLEEALARGEALAEATGTGEIMVAGGGQIFDALLDRADIVQLTEVALTVAGDAVFPRLDPRDWREALRWAPPRAAEDEADFAFVTFERRRDQRAVAGDGT
jgi:dihydrofolate reductase